MISWVVLPAEHAKKEAVYRNHVRTREPLRSIPAMLRSSRPIICMSSWVLSPVCAKHPLGSPRYTSAAGQPDCRFSPARISLISRPSGVRAFLCACAWRGVINAGAIVPLWTSRASHPRSVPTALLSWRAQLIPGLDGQPGIPAIGHTAHRCRQGAAPRNTTTPACERCRSAACSAARLPDIAAPFRPHPAGRTRLCRARERNTSLARQSGQVGFYGSESFGGLRVSRAVGFPATRAVQAGSSMHDDEQFACLRKSPRRHLLNPFLRWFTRL